MEKYWTEDQLQPEGLPESLAKLIPEQELALSAWVADWLASPQSWSVYWTKPDYFYVLPTEANIPGLMAETQSNGTNSIYVLTETVDDFTGSDGDESVYGLGSNDWLRGNGGRDLIDGGEGDDQVEGGSGNDRLFGGEGKDRLTGGSGADYMDGGNGDDEITISGFDRADGGAGRDLLYVGFGSANAVVDLAEGIAYAAGHGTARVFNFEWIESGNGDDLLFGNAADNWIRGNDGNDTIAGRGGNDDLDGGLGYDRLSGGDGDDVLRDGEDMTGGDGKDTFIIQMGEHHIIRDFEAGQDIVDLDTFGSTALNGSFEDMLAATEIVDGGLLLRIHYIFDGDEYHTSSIFFQGLTTGPTVADFVL